MRNDPQLLLNTPDIEIWPGGLLRARSNHNARLLAQASHVLRRKCDGRYLAAQLPRGLMPLITRLPEAPGIEHALSVLDAHLSQPARIPPPQGELPLHHLQHCLDHLGLDSADYAAQTGLWLIPEPAHLVLAGFDRYRRPLWLTRPAARSWQRMRDAAAASGIAMDAISGYRSHDYQLGIFERKLARGLSVSEILTVNAAPGFSEHHGGNALDISAPGEPPAEESFEHTEAFTWLQQHAGDYGFHMSYPRGNPYGIVYEPWHWCWIGIS
ncbi:peptidase [Stenotrophomonas humi]|uniref:Peptidase n=1 Tax=Stenotrophomonas humi TaxID=405444 RepID=A0A0R0C0J1_9GAMM|nr:M15 family metallopeptidase [Stenotrophomonas humi]KRG63468.1 peptidase [Stenotrophomonas humi]